MSDGSAEVRSPALHLIVVCIDPIEPSLRVFVLPFHRSEVDAKEDMAAVGRPAEIRLDRLVASDLFRRLRRLAREVHGVDLERIYFLLPLRYGGTCKGEAMAVRRGLQLLDAPRANADGLGAGCGGGACVGIRAFFGRRGVAARDGISNREAEDRIAALGGAVLDDIFPFFFISVVLLLRPGSTGGVVDESRVGGPTKAVDIILALSERERFPTVRRDQIDLRDFLVGRIGAITIFS